MRKKWRDVCTHLVFIWPLFSALLPCCWKKWMESWRDKKKWAWCLRNRSGGKEGRHWMPAWRWDTRSTTVRKRFIRKDIGYTECSFFFHQKMLEEMEEALGVWQALLLPLSSDPELEVQVKCFQKALKGTKITQDILRVCGIYLHLHQFDHVFPPVALSLFFFLLPEGGSLSISTPVPARPAVFCGGDGSAGQRLPETSAVQCY